MHSLAYFYLVSILYYYIFCATGRQGSTSVLSAAFSYGKLGRVSPPRSPTNIRLHPLIRKVGRLGHVVIQYGCFLRPSP
jgi:hypothetical protein